jgi:hypothetical protein
MSDRTSIVRDPVVSGTRILAETFLSYRGPTIPPLFRPARSRRPCSASAFSALHRVIATTPAVLSVADKRDILPSRPNE